MDRERLATRRATNDQRYVAIGFSVLGQVIVDDQRIASSLHKFLAHSTTGIRGDILHWCWIRGPCSHDDRILHRARLLQKGVSTCYRRILLANSHVDTEQVLALLIDNRIEGDSRLSGLAVTNDQFALPTTDGDHTIDSLDTCLHGCIDRLARDHPRGDTLDRTEFVSVDGSLLIKGLAQWVHHTPKQCITNGNLDDTPGGPYFVLL